MSYFRGTGENLRFLGELLEPSYLGGFDESEIALDFARRKAPGADLYGSDICDPVIHEPNLDLIVSLDVIYVPGAERALPGLQRLVGCLRPGGLLVLHLPAFQWLYSEHDVAIHTRQRFTTREVGSLLATLGLATTRLSYRLFSLFPMVLAACLPRLGRRRAVSAGEARSDLHSPPGAAINRSLLALLEAENALVARGVRFPFGSSIFAVGRKPESAGPG